MRLDRVARRRWQRWPHGPDESAQATQRRPAPARTPAAPASRRNRWPTHAAACTSRAWQVWPGSPPRVRRRHGRLLAVAGKPARRHFQKLARLLKLLELAAQLDHRVALVHRQRRADAAGAAAIRAASGLHPGVDAAGVKAEHSRQVADAAACARVRPSVDETRPDTAFCGGIPDAVLSKTCPRNRGNSASGPGAQPHMSPARCAGSDSDSRPGARDSICNGLGWRNRGDPCARLLLTRACACCGCAAPGSGKASNRKRGAP